MTEISKKIAYLPKNIKKIFRMKFQINFICIFGLKFSRGEILHIENDKMVTFVYVPIFASRPKFHDYYIL